MNGVVLSVYDRPVSGLHPVLVSCMVTPVFSSCTYVVRALRTAETVVIDPGNAVISGKLDLLERLQVKRLAYLILTHEHFDHIAGVEALRRRLGGRLVCSQPCAKAIGDPKANMSFYKDGRGVVCGPADWICERDGWDLPWSAGPIRLLPTPGHSPGGLCAAIGGHLFTGDILLGSRRTPTHLPGGDAVALRKRLGRLIDLFAPNTVVHPGHGTHFTLGELDRSRVFGPCRMVAGE